MALNFQQIIEALEGLKPDDFDSSKNDGIERLDALTQDLLLEPKPERAIPVLFAVMERLPDADLGSPGSLVHTLEKIQNYESELIASVHRAPCPLSIWMVNRVFNSTKNQEKREGWLQLLNAVVADPSASSAAKREASSFIKFQKERFK